MEPLDVEQHRALIEHAPIMLWRAGLEAQCNYFNATWLAFTGRSLEQELGTGWTAGVHPDDLKPCLLAYQEHFAKQQSFEVEYRLRRFDGAYRYVLSRGGPYTSADGAFGGLVGSCVDVDDRHAREMSVGANDFFGMTLDHLCVAGFDGYFKRLSRSWTQTLGWTNEELMSRPSLEFVHPDDREKTLIGRRLLQDGSPLGSLVNRYLCKDGTYRWFEWRSIAHDERGLVYAAARDVSEQKRTEERLREATEVEKKLQRQLIFSDRMASVGTLAAGVAHEINNPLSYVTANVAIILEELGALEVDIGGRMSELKAMALDAQSGAERIRKIVHGLKTFSRAEEERRAIISIQPVLDLAVDMTLNEIRQRARLVKDYGDTPLVDGDEARLGQVFINLLVNAAQALPEGDSTRNEIRIVTWTDAAGRAVIEVRDTGPGIPAATIHRIFDPFYTTKPVGVGTGLGLSICHNIVTGMNGEISVVSDSARGTTFSVVLPGSLPPSSEAVAPVLSSRKPLKGASVLVVDDEPAIGIVLRRILRDHDVSVVTMARNALELLASGRSFDVIFSDLMMPEMSGMSFYEELTQRFPEAARRVVFVSGGAFTPMSKAFLDQVPNELLEKPFDPESVRVIVQRFVIANARPATPSGVAGLSRPANTMPPSR